MYHKLLNFNMMRNTWFSSISINAFNILRSEYCGQKKQYYFCVLMFGFVCLFNKAKIRSSGCITIMEESYEATRYKPSVNCTFPTKAVAKACTISAAESLTGWGYKSYISRSHWTSTKTASILSPYFCPGHHTATACLLLTVSFTARDYFINVFLTLMLFTSMFNCSRALRCSIYMFPFPLAPVCLSPISPRGARLCISMPPSSFSEQTLAYSFHLPSRYSTYKPSMPHLCLVGFSPVNFINGQLDQQSLLVSPHRMATPSTSSLVWSPFSFLH